MDPVEYEKYYEDKKNQIIKKKDALIKICFDKILQIEAEMENKLNDLIVEKEKEYENNKIRYEKKLKRESIKEAEEKKEKEYNKTKNTISTVLLSGNNTYNEWVTDGVWHMGSYLINRHVEKECYGMEDEVTYEKREIIHDELDIKRQLKLNDFDYEIKNDELIISINPNIGFFDRIIRADPSTLKFKKIA